MTTTLWDETNLNLTLRQAHFDKLPSTSSLRQAQGADVNIVGTERRSVRKHSPRIHSWVECLNYDLFDYYDF
jgi:hypothetical protein